MGLNNIAKQGWDYINNVAKNISVSGLQNAWDTYISRSPDELANVARTTMQRKNTVMSNLNIDDFDKAFNSADKSNSEYVNEFNKLRGALNAGNVDEAKTVANNISERFQDGAYLKYLTEAEGKYNAIKQQIEDAPIELIKGKFINNRKEKLVNNKILNNFIDTGKTLADLDYNLNPKGIPAYFTTEDKKKNRIRAGVAAGAYMGSSMVVRGIQGGSPITNEYGERDIAGIPFI